MAAGQHITPDMMEACYRFLCTTLPFRNWRMPNPDVVEFVVSLHRDRCAHHRAYRDGIRHEIAVSAHKVKRTKLLIECMAHEMVHMRQDQLGMLDQHGEWFQGLAALVCNRHAFDFVEFV